MLTAHVRNEMKMNFIATQIECGFYFLAQGWPSSVRRRAR